jgi:peptide-methionine (S)-S-oxide reductase
VRFDPSATSFAELLDVFWQVHDPTSDSGPNTTHSYRSVIFYHDNDQRNEALAQKIKLERSGRFQSGIHTEILPASIFWEAEDYHQQYVEKNGQSANRQGDA